MELSRETITRINNRKDSHIEMHVANKIYPDKGLEIDQKYLNDIVNNLHGEVEKVDYKNAKEAARKINSWVESKTSNKIKNLINEGQLDRYTRLVLVSAIYLKGTWLKKFDSKYTQKQKFYLDNGQTTNVNMMSQQAYFNIYQKINGLSASICQLPYEGENMLMSIVLPNLDAKLNKVEKELDIRMLKVLFSKPAKLEVKVNLPKLKFEYDIQV